MREKSIYYIAGYSKYGMYRLYIAKSHHLFKYLKRPTSSQQTQPEDFYFLQHFLQRGAVGGERAVYVIERS
jgi:hypothetical protein